MTPQQQYNNFWDRLSAAYPISHGGLRLPIATHFLTETNQRCFDVQDFQYILDALLQQVREQGIGQVLQENEQSHIAPLLCGEFTGVIRFDCMLNARDELKIIEINTDYPDGLILHDYTYSILADTQTTIHTDVFCDLFLPHEMIFIAYPE